MWGNGYSTWLVCPGDVESTRPNVVPVLEGQRAWTGHVEVGESMDGGLFVRIFLHVRRPSS